jgi:hypothetical protein
VEDRIGRELRRHQLALRMIAHRARRRTICNFTGLTRERIKTLRREWQVTSKGRRRGPSPSSLSAFFRSARMRSEASVIALFCQIQGAVPTEKIPKATRYFPTLERGERLCDVYEAYRTYFPESEVNFELIVLLAIGLAEPHALELKNCITCPRVIVFDLLSVKHRNCSQCEQKEGPALQVSKRAVLSRKEARQSLTSHQKKRAADRKPEHAPEREMRKSQELKEERDQNAEKSESRQAELHEWHDGSEEGR